MPISIDNTSSGQMSSTNGTVSHIVSSGLSNSILITTLSTQDSNHANLPIGSITYGGVAMTKVRQDTSNTNNVSAACYYLLAPAAGTANVVVASTGAVKKLIINSSWSGIAQSGQPDAQIGQGTANQNSTLAAGTITTVAGSTIMIQTISSEANVSGLRAGQTFVGVGTLQGQSFENVCVSYVINSSAITGTMAGTISSGQPWNENIVSFSSVAVATANQTFKTLTGAGNI